MTPIFTNLELVANCDSFPHAETAPEQHAAMMASLYTLTWTEGDAAGGTCRTFPIGYMLRSVFAELVRVPPAELTACGLDAAAVDALVQSAGATATVPLDRLLAPQTSEAGRTQAMGALAAYWRRQKTFAVLRGWRDEPWPVYGPGGQLLFSVERAAVGLFGMTRYGVHMVAYVVEEEEVDGRRETQIRIWVSKRAADKSTYPSMLDNTVAGGLATGEQPYLCIVREADEEASLSAALMAERTEPVGTMTYIQITDERAGGSPGHIYPECQWVYDLRLDSPASSTPGNPVVVPQPRDGEVECFTLCSVAEVREQLRQGLYKPNCGLVMIDFLQRHGLLTREEEPDYDAIQARLHRLLPFPGPHQAEWPVKIQWRPTDTDV